jgi:hypothetical protein
MILGPSTGFEVFHAGASGHLRSAQPNPACGSADLFRTPSAASSLLFHVPSRGVAAGPRESFTGRGRLQERGVTENQYGGPGQVQRLDTSYAPQKG